MRVPTMRRVFAASGIASLALASAACSGNSSSSSSGAAAGGDKVGVTLITKDSSNAFFVAMQKGAKADADKQGVNLTVASGEKEGDDAGQIKAIEDAITRQDKGILITPMSTGVNAAIKKARDAGLYVIALDTPPDPANTVDITFATDNFLAGELIGKWAAKQLNGKKATIALLDLFNDKVVSVDYARDQGFLKGMGIELGDAKKNGDEAKTGKYSGGDYEIVCNEPSLGNETDGLKAMENCLAKSKDINVVYTINEPAAVGAKKGLDAAGLKDVLIVSVDGGCAGVGQVKSGIIGATAQQYPLKMATLGMEAIVKIAKGGEKPAVTDGLDFYNTGVALVTDKPADGVESIDTAKASEICWG